MTLVSLQDWDDDAVHLEHQVACVGRDATFRSVIVTLGGDLVRINPIVRFAGPGGDAELIGLFFGLYPAVKAARLDPVRPESAASSVDHGTSGLLHPMPGTLVEHMFDRIWKSLCVNTDSQAETSVALCVGVGGYIS